MLCFKIFNFSFLLSFYVFSFHKKTFKKKRKTQHVVDVTSPVGRWQRPTTGLPTLRQGLATLVDQRQELIDWEKAAIIY